MSFDIVALGEPLYELNQQPDGRFLPGFGGDTSNVVVAAARLGASTAYVTRLGSDMFGDAIMDLWRAEKVDSSAVIRDAEAPTGLYFVTHSASGHDFTYRRAGSAASRMTPADVPRDMIKAARFLHVSAISQAISQTAAAAVDNAIGIARESGTKICFDTNYRSRLWSTAKAWNAIGRVAASAHILKTSVDDSTALIGLTDPAAIADRYLSLGSEVVIVTLGADGVLLATRDAKQHIEGFKVAAIDATGAGDAFTGALLVERARGAELAMAVRFANAAAALSTQGYGAIKPLPNRTAVEQFMRSMP